MSPFCPGGILCHLSESTVFDLAIPGIGDGVEGFPRIKPGDMGTAEIPGRTFEGIRGMRLCAPPGRKPDGKPKSI